MPRLVRLLGVGERGVKNGQRDAQQLSTDSLLRPERE